MEEREIRLRCIEAAAKSPMTHADGYAVGVLTTAQAWTAWIVNPQTLVDKGRAVLGLPEKKK